MPIFCYHNHYFKQLKLSKVSWNIEFYISIGKQIYFHDFCSIKSISWRYQNISGRGSSRPFRGIMYNTYAIRVCCAISRSSPLKGAQTMRKRYAPLRKHVKIASANAPPRIGMRCCCCLFHFILLFFDHKKLQHPLPGKWRPTLACGGSTFTWGLYSKIHVHRAIHGKYGFLDPLFLNFSVKHYRKCHFWCDKSSLRWENLTFFF